MERDSPQMALVLKKEAPPWSGRWGGLTGPRCTSARKGEKRKNRRFVGVSLHLGVRERDPEKTFKEGVTNPPGKSQYQPREGNRKKGSKIPGPKGKNQGQGISKKTKGKKEIRV